ncbi:Glycogen debranching enzyme [Nitrosococcus oceani ATCC 19707]|uniref:Glycogen debranching enzyme n=2 Tax=Nitrosococcus oceani TaxID=1229 RepID=Q3JA52_NITOC|nr:amylo-alpha-1,6-glucosidase [Nitrosococcus oceani]ABA58294.1 Glycogen debranching enzyme [Nitrosococcus oceani ATCC 19707]EDZ67328.1 glycogen debranching enzyme, archaeal type, putative [Nitrosococcus oceani AFC27]KFI19224.1 glycogen debranching protein [Nitrosococcus oceani C-27]GEM18678.1 glycogen debranching protein [Nitrosococcus oceani]
MTLTLPPPIRFGREICGDLAQGERREWWLTNSLGGYAAGTVAGTLTRRYHGLLIAPLTPPLGRFLVFAKAEASLLYQDQVIPLFTNRWASGAVDPRGYVHLESFELQGRMPVWRFAVGDLALEARLWLEPDAHTTYLAYRLVNPSSSSSSGGSVRLRLKLLVNARDHHGTASPGALSPVMEGEADRLRVIHPHWFSLYFRAQGGSITRESSWIEDFDLSLERERGLPDRDRHLCVGQAELSLSWKGWVGMVASLQPETSSLEEAMERFQAHELKVLRRASTGVKEEFKAPSWIRRLVLAADSFLFARPLPNHPKGESVIAGYPWFGDWGRDTMIALPGLTLVTGRFESARRILETFAEFIDQGLLPNWFPGKGETPEYNSADGALWFIEAWRAYVAATDDRMALKRWFGVLEEIVRKYQQGTRHGIGMDLADGLIAIRAPGLQLTWMDAKVGEWVVTPRQGKPVEINALWFNALWALASLAEALGQSDLPYRDLARKTQRGFQRFIRPEGEGLFDVIDGPEGADRAVRPNQILAVSLPHSPLDATAQAGIVRQCGRELLCSYGLRSLSPAHPAYQPHYQGDVWARDGAYHQGTVWAWLLGHYALAHYRVHGDGAAAQNLLAPVGDHLLDAGLGTVSEIFDGAPPHRPRGAPAQAWSVACVLQAWWQLEQTKD